MNDNNLELAYKKIKRLEGIVGLLFVLVVVLFYQLFFKTTSNPTVIQANAFQLTDDAGNIKAGLEFQNSSPIFYLMDNDDHKRLIATHDEDGTQLFLKDQDGVTRVGIAQFSHGGGGLALHGENSKGAAVLYYKKQASLTFFNTDGKVVNQIKADENTK